MGVAGGVFSLHLASQTFLIMTSGVKMEAIIITHILQTKYIYIYIYVYITFLISHNLMS